MTEGRKRSGAERYNLFGPRVKFYRERLGLTQVELGQRANVEQPTIAMIEAGEFLPRLDRAYDLAVALHVPLDELMGGPPEPRTVHHHAAGEVTVSVSNGGLVVLGNYGPQDIEQLLASWARLRGTDGSGASTSTEQP